MASDAFFPFRDGIDAAAKEGIVAVIQPGGSMRDKEVIEAADEHEIAMVLHRHATFSSLMGVQEIVYESTGDRIWRKRACSSVEVESI